jgi:hypothetical protein
MPASPKLSRTWSKISANKRISLKFFPDKAAAATNPYHMKLFLIVFGTVGAGILGYVTEPTLLSQVIASSPKSGTAEMHSIPETSGLTADATGAYLASLKPEQLPKKVTLKEETRFSDESSGLTITVAAGSLAKLLRLDGTNVSVRPGDTAYTIIVPVSKTDLIEQLIANPPPPPATPEAEDAFAPAPATEPTPEPATEPTPAPATEPTPAPATEPTPADNPWDN